jgi:hypothetical protein
MTSIVDKIVAISAALDGQRASPMPSVARWPWLSAPSAPGAPSTSM